MELSSERGAQMAKHSTQVADWMTPDPVTATMDMSLAEAYELMSENEIRRLLVERDGELVGIITMSDILRTIPELLIETDREVRLLRGTQKVREIVTREPVTVDPEDTIQDAAERMLEYQVSGLPVVDGRKAVGIITESDIFRLVVESWGDEDD
jgi:acetoin utilization protein AcuB